MLQSGGRVPALPVTSDSIGILGGLPRVKSRSGSTGAQCVVLKSVSEALSVR